MKYQFETIILGSEQDRAYVKTRRGSELSTATGPDYGARITSKSVDILDHQKFLSCFLEHNDRFRQAISHLQVLAEALAKAHPNYHFNSSVLVKIERSELERE